MVAAAAAAELGHISKIQLTNYPARWFSVLRASSFRGPVVGRHAYRIFRDEPSFSSLADGENSVLLIETTQLLLESGPVDTVVVYSPGAEFETILAATELDAGHTRGWSKLQGTQLRTVRTYLDVILIHEYADRDYLRY